MSEQHDNESASHTPGPWRAENCAVYGPFTPTGRRRIGVVCEPHGNSSDIARANARLIAAAPDLLNAAKAFLDCYVAMVNSGDCGNWNPEEEDFVIAMRAAIQKAESGSSET